MSTGNGYIGGGGGGAGGAGKDGVNGNPPTTSLQQNGGVGRISTIINTTQATSAAVGEVSTNLYFAGGGGGGSDYTQAQGANGIGGLGGGGDGQSAVTGQDGAANTGGGGGGYNGGSGGSGVVILRMLTLNYSGITTGSPTVLTGANDTMLIYKGDGTYTG
jgi:hypothetical protein